MNKTICLALTGASGMPYGLRLLECLLAAGCNVQLLYSQAAQVVARQEMDFELPSRPGEAKAALLARLNDHPQLAPTTMEAKAGPRVDWEKTAETEGAGFAFLTYVRRTD